MNRSTGARATCRLLGALTATVLIGSQILGSRPALAVELVLGKLILVSDPAPGVDPARRKVVVVAKEAASPSAVVGDPIANGATLEVIASGGSTTSQTFTLPPGAGGTADVAGWKALGSLPIGYAYRDALGVNGPVKVAIIKKTARGDFFFKAVILGKLGSGPQPHVTVVPPVPGDVAGATFTINGGETYCTVFGDIAGGEVFNVPTSGVSAGTKGFKIKNATAEVGCPNGD